jgi:hypothetical protein
MSNQGASMAFHSLSAIDSSDNSLGQLLSIEQQLKGIGFGANGIQLSKCIITYESAGDRVVITGYEVLIEEFQGTVGKFKPFEYKFMFVGYCMASSRFYIAMTHVNLKRAEGTFFNTIREFDTGLQETMSKVNASYQDWIAEG